MFSWPCPRLRNVNHGPKAAGSDCAWTHCAVPSARAAPTTRSTSTMMPPARSRGVSTVRCPKDMARLVLDGSDFGLVRILRAIVQRRRRENVELLLPILGGRVVLVHVRAA